MVSLKDIYRKSLHYVSALTVNGESIFADEWDMLIVLDACRFDLFKEVAPNYDYIERIDNRSSVDTMTPVWMEKTFTENTRSVTQNTYYLCANPASDEMLSDSWFETLDEIWRYEWDDQVGNVRAESVTKRAITVGREQQPNKLLVHYNQPHWPFIPDMETSDGQGIQLSQFGEHQEHRVWERLRRGDVSKEKVWEGYRENLRYVLDSVGVLMENIDADSVIITSDHGNALGEWGIYGHPAHMPVPAIRQVPWAETTATDSETMTDHLEYTGENMTANVKQKLRDLGYH